jgi:hypothetical protein
VANAWEPVAWRVRTAVFGFPGPMTALWGEQDPSAVVAMARHLGMIQVLGRVAPQT